MQDSEQPPPWGEIRRAILGSRIERDERCEGIRKSSEKLLVVTKLEGDNQGGEKIQGILEERGEKNERFFWREGSALLGMASLVL